MRDLQPDGRHRARGQILYALRDVTATVDSLPLITASIMSKKIAEGVGALVLDVKTGAGAFMRDESDARRLAESMVDAGRRANVRTEALITCMEAPLGRAVGNGLEVAEGIEVLRGGGPADVRELSLALATRMLVVAGIASDDADARARTERALASGAALQRFAEMVEAQGGDRRVVDDLDRLPRAPGRATFVAPTSGLVSAVDAEAIGRAAVALGAGRDRVDADVDPAVGIVVLKKPGERVVAGEPLVEFHYRSPASLEAARRLVAAGIRVGDHAPSPGPLIRSQVR